MLLQIDPFTRTTVPPFHALPDVVLFLSLCSLKSIVSSYNFLFKGHSCVPLLRWLGIILSPEGQSKSLPRVSLTLPYTPPILHTKAEEGTKH